jgi:hypothetical protein
VSFVDVPLNMFWFKKLFFHVCTKVCEKYVLLHSLVNQILKFEVIKKSLCILEVIVDVAH